MRQKRKIIKGSRYHVMARANRQEMILGSRALKLMFLGVVKRAQKRYKFIIQNFCIMGNHIHFIMEPLKDESLSKIMQWILSVFAMKYNRTFNYVGHVFYDRFKSKIIEDFRQYVATFIYIMQNPVKANLVNCPEDYEFSGINFMKRGIYDVTQPPDLILKLLFPSIQQRLINTTAII